jgi:hypothetical protein
MNSSKCPPQSLKERLQQAGQNSEKLMLQFFELNYVHVTEDRGAQSFTKNFEVYFFEDYKRLLAGWLNRKEGFT